MSEQRRRHSAGWYAGAAAFWLIAFWIVAVGLASIIPQIFWPEARAGAPVALECAPELRRLERELVERLADAFSEVPVVPLAEQVRPRLAAWDRAHAALRPNCTGAEQSAWAELGRLRHGAIGLLSRFDREQLPRIRSIERTLSGVRDHPISEPR